jgi:hypothetical protein
MWSKFDLDEAFEEHTTQSLGIRHNIGNTMALKADVSFFDDRGINPTPTVGPAVRTRSITRIKMAMAT